MVRLLFECGSAVDMSNMKEGVVAEPPHWVAAIGHDEIAESLIQAGASIHAKDGQGLTPVDVADSCMS